jgi:hypothetical protein
MFKNFMKRSWMYEKTEIWHEKENTKDIMIKY